MKILLVGALSWNPERIRALCERGHSLWGLWSRSMSWEQGPYLATNDCIRQVTLNDVVKVIREERIDCVYSLFQVYHHRLWAAASDGVENDVWTALRTLLSARRQGKLDLPIVRHWGFDIQNMDLDVARAFDGQIFCNRQKFDYWTLPRRQHGCGIDPLGSDCLIDFLDGDRQKLEFMNDDFPEPLSSVTGEIHTVCIGRPFGIDYLAAARRGIHVHVYGNRFDDIVQMMARDITLAGAIREAKLLRRFVHVHPSLQTQDKPWEEIHRAKSRWVREFARYDAGWSYIGTPAPWDPLEDRGAIPNRHSTYMLAGLPVITNARPGFYRYDEPARLGVHVEFGENDYDKLRDRLDREVRTGERRANAVRERAGYSFDATADALIGFLANAAERYFRRPLRERTHFVSDNQRLIHFFTSPGFRSHALGLMRIPGQADSPRVSARDWLASAARVLRDHRVRRVGALKAKVLARHLADLHEPTVSDQV